MLNLTCTATQLLKRTVPWKLTRQMHRFTSNQSETPQNPSENPANSVNGDAKRPNPKPVLTLYTKEVCPLCDDAKEVLEPFMHRFHFQQVDIEAPLNKDWWEMYKYEIPVFHLNGEFLMKHKVNVKLLERKLKELGTNS